LIVFALAGDSTTTTSVILISKPRPRAIHALARQRFQPAGKLLFLHHRECGRAKELAAPHHIVNRY